MPNDYAGGRRERSRGREADRPSEIPAPGWKDVLWRTYREVNENNIFLISGGVTYSVLFALFPFMAALVSIYGLALDAGQIEHQVGSLAGVLPEQSQQLLREQLHQLAARSGGSLGVGAVVGLLVALWTASRGMSGMITALDIAYEQEETRSFLRFNLVALALTLGAILGGLIAIVLIAVLPAVIQFMGLGGFAKWAALVIEWPLLIVLVMAGLAILYRYGPDRDEPKWRWLSPGAIAATILWVIASIGFTIYVANFGSYDATYGSLGGALIMLTWLYLSSFVVLLGAVINAQTEQQTRKDSTVGQPRPLGARQAKAADTVAPSPGD